MYLKYTYVHKIRIVVSGLQALLKHKGIWRAEDIAEIAAYQRRTNLPTGFTALDRLLYGNGWPRDGLVEILPEVHGCGELQLLIPGLCRLMGEETRWIAWVNPPFVPYAPALNAHDIDVNRVFLVHPKNHREALWATEKILESGSCSAILVWLDEQQLEEKQLRRIQTRAKEGRAWITIFRPMHAQVKSSPAELRLSLRLAETHTKDQVNLSILKRKGGWPVPNLSLQLYEYRTLSANTRIAAQWQQWRQQHSLAGVKH